MLEESLNNVRHEEFYKEFHLITALFKGQFQGRAWAKREGLENLSVIGSSITDVLEKLKSAANTEIKRRSMALRETLPHRHQQFLEKRKIEYKGFRSITRTYRISHCYNCKSAVDSAVDFECVVCGWIVCNECAACGCGYSWVALQLTHKARQPAKGVLACVLRRINIIFRHITLS